MACCAFAVILLSQLLMPFRTLARSLGLSVVHHRPDPAVVWRPGLAVARPKRRFSRGMAVGGLIVADGLLLLVLAQVGAFAALPRLAPENSQAAQVESLLHAAVCGEWKKS